MVNMHTYNIISWLTYYSTPISVFLNQNTFIRSSFVPNIQSVNSPYSDGIRGERIYFPLLGVLKRPT